jgi:hypothetical protein
MDLDRQPPPPHTHMRRTRRTRAQRSTQANARAARHADLWHLRKGFYGFICVLRGRDELINLLPSNGLGPAANESRMRPSHCSRVDGRTYGRRKSVVQLQAQTNTGGSLDREWTRLARLVERGLTQTHSHARASTQCDRTNAQMSDE